MPYPQLYYVAQAYLQITRHITFCYRPSYTDLVASVKAQGRGIANSTITLLASYI